MQLDMTQEEYNEKLIEVLRLQRNEMQEQIEKLLITNDKLVSLLTEKENETPEVVEGEIL